MKRTNFFLVLFLAAVNSAFAQGGPTIKFAEFPKAKRIDVVIDGKLFTSLLYADSLKKHVLWPVIAANGVAVTRGYPIAPKLGDQVDHPHQIGVWFNYGDVNGADYWNNSTKIDTNKKAYGSIKVQKVTGLKNGKGRAALTVKALWFNPGGKTVLEESSLFIFKEEKGRRIIERQTSLKALADVMFKDNKEGLFGIRVSRQLESPSEKAADLITFEGVKKVIDKAITTGLYENSAGLKGEEVFSTRTPWLKLSGQIDKKPITLVLMDHSQNVNYPGFWMARGYGLFAINPLGAEVYTSGKEKLNFHLKKGQSVTFKHSLLIGEAISSSEIEKMHKEFTGQ